MTAPRSADPPPEPIGAAAIAGALRSPLLPTPLARLLGPSGAPGPLAALWPQLAPSVETQGFIESARYMVDMALDAVVQCYEPVLSAEARIEALHRAGLDAADVDAVLATLDMLHLVQPQALLLLAALAEAGARGEAGGGGRPAPRLASARERLHLATPVVLAPPGQPPLPAIAAGLAVSEAPDLYRAIARWPVYLDAAWAETQHLDAYPPLRDRARGLYYYARDAARFLAHPLRVEPSVLAAERASIEAALPLLATMLLHCCAMRVALGVTAPEVADRQ